jgi:hypothetical protein
MPGSMTSTVAPRFCSLLHQLLAYAALVEHDHDAAVGVERHAGRLAQVQRRAQGRHCGMRRGILSASSSVPMVLTVAAGRWSG